MTAKLFEKKRGGGGGMGDSLYVNQKVLVNGTTWTLVIRQLTNLLFWVSSLLGY